jgi:hypothetical protein
MFFFGGDDEPYKGELWNPVYTGLLLKWVYVLFSLTIATLIAFAIWQFIVKFKQDVKGSLMGLGVLVLFAAVLIISYTLGDATPLPLLNSDVASYNIPFWLKVTDMWIYCIYILMGLVVLAVLWGSVKKILSK